MKLKTLIFFLLVFTSFVNAQRMLKVSVSIDGQTKELSSITRRGSVYISAKELGQILSASPYYNSDAAKIELKFQDYNLKFTARNQFIILISKTSSAQQVYQLPISTLLIKDDVFIPLLYSLPYISFAYGKEINYDSSIGRTAVKSASCRC